MNIANHIDRARVGEPAMITRRAAFALCRPAPKLRCSPRVPGPAESAALIHVTPCAPHSPTSTAG